MVHLKENEQVRRYIVINFMSEITGCVYTGG